MGCSTPLRESPWINLQQPSVVLLPEAHVVIVVLLRTDSAQENGGIRIRRVIPSEENPVPDRQDRLRIGREGWGELDALRGVTTGTGGHPEALHR